MADFQQLSDVLVLVMKKENAAILERVAALEQDNKNLRAQLQDQTTLRDRIVVLETKAGMPVPPDAAIGDLQHRIAALESKAAQPVERVDTFAGLPFDFQATTNRITTLETTVKGWEAPVTIHSSQIAELNKDIGVMRERVSVVETKPIPEPDLSAIVHRLSTVENFANAWQAPATKAETQIDALSKDVAAIRERVSVMEVRAQIPGPPGPAGHDGKDGHDGLNGKDGADGLGFDDLTVEDHTLVFQKGTRRKDFPLGYLQYKFVYQDGQEYHPGHIVTWGGSAWHCNQTTRTKPGEGSKDWTLMVKRGRDGKDGVDAPALPVVKVGG